MRFYILDTSHSPYEVEEDKFLEYYNEQIYKVSIEGNLIIFKNKHIIDNDGILEEFYSCCAFILVN